jgi:inorganic triphosphatase YgiF
METEARFLVESDAELAALAGLGSLGGFTLSPAGVLEVTDSYVDTPDRRLFAAGYACRIRESAAGRVAGLKSLAAMEPRAADGALHVRAEHETPIGPGVDARRPALWPAGDAREIALRIAGDTGLVPLRTVRQTRWKSIVSMGGRALFEMSADRVELPSVHRGLEVELLPGATEKDLALFTSLLRESFPLAPDGLSKLERALSEGEHR